MGKDSSYWPLCYCYIDRWRRHFYSFTPTESRKGGLYAYLSNTVRAVTSCDKHIDSWVFYPMQSSLALFY